MEFNIVQLVAIILVSAFNGIVIMNIIRSNMQPRKKKPSHLTSEQAWKITKEKEANINSIIYDIEQKAEAGEYSTTTPWRLTSEQAVRLEKLGYTIARFGNETFISWHPEPDADVKDFMQTNYSYISKY